MSSYNTYFWGTRKMRDYEIINIFFAGIIALSAAFLQTDDEFAVEVQNSENEQILDDLKKRVAEEPDSVIYKVDELLQEKITVGTRNVFAKAQYMLGLAHYFKGKYLVSNYFYDKVLELPIDEVSNEILEAVHNNKGVNYELMRNYEEAIIEYLASLKYAKKRQYAIGIGQTKLNLGVLFNKIEQKQKSLEYHYKALEIFEQENDSFHIALSTMNIGAFEANSDFESANTKFISALELFSELKQNHMIAEVYYHLGVVHINKGNIELGRKYALSSLELQSSEIYNDNKINTINLLIEINKGNDQLDSAAYYIDLLTQAIESGKVSPDYLDNESFDKYLRIYAQKGSTKQLQKLLKIRDNFYKKSLYTRYEQIYEQYEYLSDVSEEYADSLLANHQVLADQKTSFLAKYPFVSSFILFIVVLGGFIFYLRNGTETSIGHTNHNNRTGNLEYYLGYAHNTYQNIAEQSFEVDTSKHKRSDDQLPEEEKKNKKLEKLYENIDAYLVNEECYTDENLTRDQVAREFHTNTKYVSLAIKEFSGLKFNDYINRYRIHKAIKIYRERVGGGDLNNVEIAFQCGYSTESTFYRNFKKFTGTTPKTYIARLNNNKKVTIRKDHL